MKISNYFKATQSGLLIFSLILISNQIRNNFERPILKISKQESASNFKLPMFQYFNFGNKRMLSSLLWISTILQSDEEHYKGKDLNSWMYLRFNNIAELDPLFKYNYIFGGIYLSIIKDDLPGASWIYNKGLEKYPDDYQLLKDAGFHFYYEEGNFARAYPIFEKLVQIKANSIFPATTFARLLSSNGNKEDALKLLLSRYDSIEDKNSLIAVKSREHIYSLKAEIDLECLNTQKTNCNRFDADNEEYILKNNKFQAKKNWKPFLIKNKKK